MNKQEIRKGLESGKLRERGNGWKNVRPRSQMRAIDRGYQGSEKKKRRPAAKYSFFGGKR
jgi:hypothetical protein